MGVRSGSRLGWARFPAVVWGTAITSAGFIVVVEGELRADGQFSLNLPGETVLRPYLQSPSTYLECGTSFLVSPSDLKVTGTIFSLGTGSPPTLSQYIAPASSVNYESVVGAEVYGYVFADRDGSITGNCRGPDPGGRVLSWNASFKKGWNLFVRETTGPNSFTYSGPVDEPGIPWLPLPLPSSSSGRERQPMVW